LSPRDRSTVRVALNVDEAVPECGPRNVGRDALDCGRKSFRATPGVGFESCRGSHPA
jgi:hypothetical protein